MEKWGLGDRATSRLIRLWNRCRAGLRLGLVSKFRGILGLEGQASRGEAGQVGWN